MDIGRFVDEKFNMDKLTDKEIHDIYEKMNSFNQPIYDFVLDYNSYLKKTRSYGTDTNLSALEAHILKDIESIENVSGSLLAKKWNLTPSSISQNLSKLEKLGFITKSLNKKNKRFFIIKVTEKGKVFNKAHEIYDIKSIIDTNKKLLRKYSEDEIILFHKMISDFRDIINE